MTKALTRNLTKVIFERIRKASNNASVRAITLSLLFLISGIGGSILIPSAAASPLAASRIAAATPLSQAEANWAGGNGNQFNQNFNPQNQINASNAQYLGIQWLFPLPVHPTPLLSVAGGLGVDTAPLIINGTIYAITQFGQVLALDASNGNLVWSDILPIFPNSTNGISGIARVSLHLHDGAEQYTTKLFPTPSSPGGTPTLWYSTPDLKVWAINALNGKYELNFTFFSGTKDVDGNSPTAIEGGNAPNVLVDQQRGIVITSIGSSSSPATGRCLYRGWNVLMSPPQLMWTAFCTPPQPGGNLPVDPSWEIKQVNSMKGAQIFYPGPAYHNGGPIPGTAVVDLKTLSSAQLNATLYNDWGYANQSPTCAAWTGGSSTGSTASGWGGPWLLGTGPTAGLAFVNTNNKDPYNSPCSPGPNLWAASVLALNETNGQWVWGFQTAAHDIWDLDCSWWQGMGNETVNGVNTQVLWKLCKNGYMVELNALTGSLIWAYTPPISAIPRCPNYCDMLNPLNSSQMSLPFLNPSLQPTLMYPGPVVGESEASYSPTLNYIFFADEVVPTLAYYVAPNASNYKTNSGMLLLNAQGGPLLGPGGPKSSNATLSAVNAATGQLVWQYFVPVQGYRGGVTNSGNIVYMTLSSGDLLIINAQTGKLIKDQFIGGPLNVLPSIGATQSGKMEVIFPITAGIVTWGSGGVPGDVIAMSLQNVPAATVSTVTTTVGGATSTVTTTQITTVGAGQTATVTTTATAASGGGGSDTTLYGVAAVAVIFIIATGYFAMKSRKAAP